MQHLEYAQAVLQAFSEYANDIASKEDKALYLELGFDGSGCVRDEDTKAVLLEFDDLRELLVLLLVNQLGMENIPKP